MSADHKISATKALLLLSVFLAGWMDARAEVPTPSAKRTYLPVEDLPADRKAMTTDEVSKLKQELAAARDRQSAAVKARDDRK
jgi:hypothetical protein